MPVVHCDAPLEAWGWSHSKHVMLCRNLPVLIGQFCFHGASRHWAAGGRRPADRLHPTSSGPWPLAPVYFKVLSTAGALHL